MEGVQVIEATAVVVALSLWDLRRELEPGLLEVAGRHARVVEDGRGAVIRVVLNPEEARSWHDPRILLKVLSALEDLMGPFSRYALVAVGKGPLNGAQLASRRRRRKSAKGA